MKAIKMKTKKLNFSIGESVRVIGKFGKFRYVAKNIVRAVKTGRCYSVKPSRIISSDYLLTLKCRAILIAISVIGVSLFFYVVKQLIF